MKNTTKKTRGIRKPRGYIPGEWSNNLYIAEHDYVKGNEPVSGQAVQFFGDCKTFSDLTQLALTENGEVVQGKYPGSLCRVKSKGYNAQLMNFYRMKKLDVDRYPHSLAYDICEQIMRAVQTGDDWFFQDLARLCKFEKSRPPITLEYWLGIVHRDFSKPLTAGTQNRFFTAPELCELAFMRGFKYTDDGSGKRVEYPVRRMHEICGKLGIKLLDGREREKKKSNFNEIFQKLKSPQPITIDLTGSASPKRK
jgi:hypothetical protein